MGKALATLGGVQFMDNAGAPLNGGKLYTYEPGTTTAKTTYQDAALSTAHANPIVLDSVGRPPSNAVWCDGETKFIVKTSADVTLFTLDNFNQDQTGFGDYSTKNADIITKTATYSLVAGDDGKLLVATGTWTLSNAVSEATLGNGFKVTVYNAGTGLITFDPTGTVEGLTVFVVGPGEKAEFRCDGTNWRGLFLFSTQSLAGHINGLVISNNTTDANNDIDISIGTCADSTKAYLLHLTSGLTKQLDAAWAAGTNAGGLDTGSKAASTWYYVWLIRKDSNAAIDALFSLSATSPTMPSGYTGKRRLGSIRTDGSSNLLGFLSEEGPGGSLNQWWTSTANTVEATSVSQSATTWTSRTLSYIPPNVPCLGYHALIAFTGFTANGAVAARPAGGAEANANTGGHAACSTIYISSTVNRGDGQIQIRHAGVASPSVDTNCGIAITSGLTLVTKGWMDHRRS